MLQYKKILKLRVNKMNAFDVSGLFSTQTDAVSVKPYGNGHINSTFLVTAQSGKRYILQKVNGRVFKNPDAKHNKGYGISALKAFGRYEDAYACRA